MATLSTRRTHDALDPDRLVVAWTSFVGPAGLVQAENELRASDPRVRQAPANFVELDVPREEWPSVLDRAFADTKEQERLLAEERRARFEGEARANRVKIDKPMLYRLKRDVMASRGGQPATILKGSVVLEGDPLLAEFLDDFEAA